MDKVYISYFYKIRFFNNKYIPISTAVWDPKWYHNFQDQSHIFLDKNNVLNGMRYPMLSPGKSCEGLCNGGNNGCGNDPSKCKFIEEYEKQLNYINFNDFTKDIDELIASYSTTFKVDSPIPVFIVHEAPDNPCSERWSLFRWLEKNGVTCKEFDKIQD